MDSDADGPADADDPTIAGFGPGLDGFQDVADQRSRALARATRAAVAARPDDRWDGDADGEWDDSDGDDSDGADGGKDRRTEVREAFLDAVGGLPDRPADPTVAVETVLDREADPYAVEAVVFESVPGVHVTANCYVPDGDAGGGEACGRKVGDGEDGSGDGRGAESEGGAAGAGPGDGDTGEDGSADDGDGRPAALLLCGHLRTAKADPENQRTCATLAANGVLALAVDPIALGERDGYPDPPDEVGSIPVDSGVYAHSRAGQTCAYAGGNLARYFLADARAALDYLAGRPDVDADRLGATGTSGGGVQSIYLGLVDDRVRAAVPCCCLCTRERYLDTGIPRDAELVLEDALGRGIDPPELLAALAPLPVRVCATRSDFFPVAGVREGHRRARRAYAARDAVDSLDLAVVGGGHASTYGIGRPVFEWLCTHLDAGPYDPADHDPVDPEALRCTPEGSVGAAHPDGRSLGEVVGEHAADVAPDAGGTGRGATDAGGTGRGAPDAGGRPGGADAGRAPGGDDAGGATGAAGVDPAAVRGAVVDRFGLDRPTPRLDPRVTATVEEGDLTVRRVFFEAERDPAVAVAGVLVTDRTAVGGASGDEDGNGDGGGDDATGERPAAGSASSSAPGPTPAPAVVRFADGTAALPERSASVAALAAEYGTAFVFDPRGVGAVRHRPLPDTWTGEGYDGVYGTEHKLVGDAAALGRSPVGDRAFDTLRAVAYLRRAVGPGGGVDPELAGSDGGAGSVGDVGHAGSAGSAGITGDTEVGGTDGGRDGPGGDDAARPVALVGEGVGARHALYAGVVADGVASVDLRDLGRSFRARATDPGAGFDPRLAAYDVLGAPDLPAALAALRARDIDLSVDRRSG